MIKIISFKIIFAAWLLCFFLIGQVDLVSAATVRMVPFSHNNLPGERIEYSLSGEGLEGLGSIEISLHYPTGILSNAQVVFDSSFQGDSAAAQANTSLPGTLRIGVIDATGFPTGSGELARISFDVSESASQSVKLSADVNITDLHGQRIDSRMEVEPAELDTVESEETEEIKDILSKDSTFAPLDVGTLTDSHSQSHLSQDIVRKRGFQAQSSRKMDSHYPVPESGFLKPSSHSTSTGKGQKGEFYRSENHIPQQGKAPANNTLGIYNIKKVKGEDTIYEFTVDLPEEGLNFALSNGEILEIIKMDGMTKLTIRAEKGCMLYLMANGIEKIPIG